ncbi:MAG: hypothetical protein Q4C41_04190 [Eggerthellaceae bacterium]|nr:hypothetical protein [Eggerthellaceae bacterium]
MGRFRGVLALSLAAMLAVCGVPAMAFADETSYTEDIALVQNMSPIGDDDAYTTERYATGWGTNAAVSARAVAGDEGRGEAVGEGGGVTGEDDGAVGNHATGSGAAGEFVAEGDDASVDSAAESNNAAFRIANDCATCSLPCGTPELTLPDGVAGTLANRSTDDDSDADPDAESAVPQALDAGDDASPGADAGTDSDADNDASNNADAKTDTQTSIPQVGETRTFTSDYRTDDAGNLMEIPCTLVQVGDDYTIWVETSRKDALTLELLEQIEAELPRALAKVSDCIGSLDPAEAQIDVDIDRDGKTAFVFHDYGEYSAGYFWMGDLYDPKDYEETDPATAEALASSNCTDMLHMNLTNTVDNDGTASFNLDVAMNTLVHEYTHLVTFAYTTPEDENDESAHDETWLNESVSKAAEGLTGYGEAASDNISWIAAGYLDYGYTEPFVFEGYYVPTIADTAESLDATNARYGQWYLFSLYLVAQTKGLNGGGEHLWKTVHKTGNLTVGSLMKTLRGMGYLGNGASADAQTFDDVVENYNLALVRRDATGPYSLVNNASASPSEVYGAEVPAFSFEPENLATEMPGGGSAAVAPVEIAGEPDEAAATSGSGKGRVRVVKSTCAYPLANRVSFTPYYGRLHEGDPIVVAPASLGLYETATVDAFPIVVVEVFADGSFGEAFLAGDEDLVYTSGLSYLAACAVFEQGVTLQQLSGVYELAEEGEGGDGPGAGGESELPETDGGEGTPLAATGDDALPAAAVLAAFASLALAVALCVRAVQTGRSKLHAEHARR